VSDATPAPADPQAAAPPDGEAVAQASGAAGPHTAAVHDDAQGDPPSPADLPARWPVAVRAELVRRRRDLMASLAAGTGPLTPAEPGSLRVLDLGVPAGRGLLAAALAGERNDAPAYDVVLSVAGLARFADLGTTIDAIETLLVPGGALLAVEPAPTPGTTGMLLSTLGALIPAARGAHLARDLQATLRAGGFAITDVERFTMHTLVWPLRPFLQLRAVRTADLAATGSDAAATP
jgi:hypothetical protein